jgi:D-sedoheptulose 7-phosphate isomerase
MKMMRYFDFLKELIDSMQHDAEHLADVVYKCIKDEKSIWIMGNGGSASTAEHFETDLSFVKMGSDFPKVKVAALSSNSAIISAIANDIGYEHIFSHQLHRKAAKGDVCIFISASGNSPNLLKASQTAKDLGLVSIGILGFDGGKLANEVDYLAVVRTEIGRYGPVEDLHLAICHELTGLISQKLMFKNRD